MTINFHTFQPEVRERESKRLLTNKDGDAHLLSLNSLGYELADTPLTNANVISGAQTAFYHNYYTFGAGYRSPYYSIESDSADNYINANEQTVSAILTSDSDIDINFLNGHRIFLTRRNGSLRLGLRTFNGKKDLSFDYNIGANLSTVNYQDATGVQGNLNYPVTSDNHIQVAVAINFAGRSFNTYINGTLVPELSSRFTTQGTPVKQDPPSASPDSIGTVSCTTNLIDFRIYNSLFNETQVRQTLFANPYVSDNDVFSFAQSNNLKRSGVSGNVDAFDDIDLEKFIQSDFTSASAIAALDTAGLSDASETLANLRGLQRLLLTGLALGPDSNGSINYGNRLQLQEAFYLLSAGFYSSSVLARAQQSDIEIALYRFAGLQTRTIGSEDSDVVQRAKSRANNRIQMLIASARQRSHLVSLAYINAKNHTTPALAAANRNQDDRLTFENQFNSNQYYEVPDHRSVYSTSAYLVALKELIDENVNAPSAPDNRSLQLRRPDIDTLLLSADNALTLQPSLNIVNRVLRYHARPDENSQDLLTDQQQDSTRFPLAFPHNVAFDQVVNGLEDADSSISEIAKVLGANTSRPQNIGISPSMVDVIATDPDYGVDVPQFVDSNNTHQPWGYSSEADLEGTSTGNNKPAPLALITEFVKRADIEEYELHPLLFGDLSTAEIAEDKHLQLYFNSPASGHTLTAETALGTSGDANEITNLDSLRQDRLHRFLRMSKSANLDTISLHRLLRATGNRLNADFMRIVSAFQHFNQEFDTSLDEFIGLIADLRDCGQGSAALTQETPLRVIFYRRGQSIELFDGEGKLTNLIWQRDSSVESLSIRAELSARLGITESQLMNISRQIVASGSITLNKSNLSALFRLAYLMQQLDVSANDLHRMLMAIPVNEADLIASDSAPTAKLDVIEILLAYIQKFKDVNFSLVRAYELSRTDNRLSVTQERLDNFHFNLQLSRENIPSETIESFNAQLTEAGAADLVVNDTQFAEIFDQDGVISDPTASILETKESGQFVLGASLNSTERDQQVDVFKQVVLTINDDQITLFDNTLIAELNVNPVYYREFSSWAGMILAEPATTAATRTANNLPAATVDADAPTLEQRLSGQNNDLRARLLDLNTDLAVRRREFQTLRQLAELLGQFQLSETDLRRLLQRPDILSDFAVNRLPQVEELLGLKRYQLVVDKIDNVDSPIFEIAYSRPVGEQDTSGLREQVITEILTEFEQAEESEISPLIAYFEQGNTGRPMYLTLAGLANIILAYDYSAHSRIQPQCMLDILTLGSDASDSYAEVMPTSLALDASLSANGSRSTSYEASNLERERDRLLSLALHRMETRGLPVSDADSLYRYLLLDVNVGGEATTSPVREATLALQLYGDAIVNNQESGHTANATFREYWEWMQYFTTWQANRRTFFETENFLLPEVRRNKTEAFVTLEATISSAMDNPEQAETAFREYAESLLKTVDLENVGVAISANALEPDAVVARARTGTIRNIYIRFTNLTESEDNAIPYLGGEWQQLPLNLAQEDSVSITPVFEQGRWHLFWVTYQQSGQTPSQEPLYAAQLNRLSQNIDGGWETPEVIRERNIPLEYGQRRNDYAFRYVSAFPSGSFHLFGSSSQLNSVWSRQERIEEALTSGKDPVDVIVQNDLYDLRYSSQQDDINRATLVDRIIARTNQIALERNLSEDESFYYEYTTYHSDPSGLKNAISSANNSGSRTPTDGIVLSLPPVFGLFNRETIYVKDYSNFSSVAKTSAMVSFINIDTVYTDNEESIEDDSNSIARDTLILLSDGKQRVASGLNLRYNRTIEPRRLRADGESQEDTYDYYSQADLRALSRFPVNNGNTTLRAITANNSNFTHDMLFLTAGTTLYQTFFGRLGGQDYLFDKDKFKFIRTSSQAGTDLLERLRRHGIDSLMHYDSQRIREASFSVGNPNLQVAYPRPSERLSFNDFNGQLYRELFFHAPMMIATAFKNSEQYDAADRWYRYVYNPKADAQNLSLDSGDSRDFHDAAALRNNNWQCLFLRNTAPSEFVCDAYEVGSGERGSFQSNLIEYFKTKVDNRRAPNVVFKAPVLDYSGNSSDNLQTWITSKGKGSISDLLIHENSQDRYYDIQDTVMRYRGTQYLSQGTYYLQLVIDDGFAVFLNGELVHNRNGGTAPLIVNAPLHIEQSGIQHLEILYQNGGGPGKFKVQIAAALPGIELARERLESDEDAEAARLEDSYDFHLLASQSEAEQRLLQEINVVDDTVARQTYIRDPYNPHALAAVRPSAYQTWAFYEFIDNMMKRGDKLFRRLTREDLAEATLIYTRVSELLGEMPKNMGELDYLPSDSNVDQVRKAGLLDFDNDGDIDLDDADIQAQRMLDSTGRLVGAYELMLEQRLSNVTRNMSTATLLTEAYTGDDASAVQTQPRQARLSDDSSAVMYAPVTGTPTFAPQNYLNNSYFAIPPNQRTLRLWDTVASRLFNIRNSRDINGRRINLALTQPPLDPLALARLFANGGTLGQLRGNTNMAIPHYRFNYMINRAKDVTQMVSGFGTRLLNIMEKQDATELEALRASHEQSILEMSAEVLRHQVMSVEHNLEIFYRQYETARYQEYRTAGLMGANVEQVANANSDYQSLDNIPIDLEQADDNGSITSLRGDEGDTFPANNEENAARILSITKNALEIATEAGFGAAELTDTAPNIFGLAAGGHNYSAIGKGIIKLSLGTIIKGLDLSSSIVAENGSRLRRKAGWLETRNLAVMDQAELKDRIVQGLHDLNAARAQYDNLQREIESNQEIEQFIRSGRRTRTELYRWLSNRMSNLYFQAYQLALSMAKEAEHAFNFELGSDKVFVRGDYWDNTQQGLLAGDGLLLGLQRMHHEYEQSNERRLEVVKPVSLANNLDIYSSENGFVRTTSGTNQGTNLIELLKAKPAEERRISFELPSRVYARDYPGHYRRMIKSVNVTVPAVVGPYQTLSATLRQMNNKVLLVNDKAAAAELAEQRTNQSPTLPLGVRTDYRNNQSIAVSGAVNDAGMFQLNFGDDRLLPFENTGADSSWELEFSPGLPDEVFDSITDIIVEVSYYAEEGGSDMRDEVLTVL